MNINKDKIESLAQALAAGGSVAAWAEVHDVPCRTAYRWAAEAGLKARVRGPRQGLVTDAVVRLAGAATAAVDTPRGLLAAGQPATVRLGAVRAILTASIDVRAHAELADRITRLGERGERGFVQPRKPRREFTGDSPVVGSSREGPAICHPWWQWSGQRWLGAQVPNETGRCEAGTYPRQKKPR